MKNHAGTMSMIPSMEVRLLSITMAPALAVIMGVDLRIRGSEEILIHGIADEVAHLLTALVMLSAVRSLGIRVSWVAVVLGAIAPDIEHILAPLGRLGEIGATGRGVLHTLLPGAAVVLLGLIFPPMRAFLVSLGLALLSHVARDAATSAIPALWPHAEHAYHLRYSVYLAMLAVSAMITAGIVALVPRASVGERAAQDVSSTSRAVYAMRSRSTFNGTAGLG